METTAAVLPHRPLPDPFAGDNQICAIDTIALSDSPLADFVLERLSSFSGSFARRRISTMDRAQIRARLLRPADVPLTRNISTYPVVCMDARVDFPGIFTPGGTTLLYAAALQGLATARGYELMTREVAELLVELEIARRGAPFLLCEDDEFITLALRGALPAIGIELVSSLLAAARHRGAVGGSVSVIRYAEMNPGQQRNRPRCLVRLDQLPCAAAAPLVHSEKMWVLHHVESQVQMVAEVAAEWYQRASGGLGPRTDAVVREALRIHAAVHAAAVGMARGMGIPVLEASFLHQ